jgi:hypothetical protein
MPRVFMLRRMMVSGMGMLTVQMEMWSSRMMVSSFMTARQMHMRKTNVSHGKNCDDQD